jgi:hypothetical protein
MGAAQSGVEEDKKGSDWAQVREKREYSKTILLDFRARAGSKQCISFFFRLIGFKELK